MLTGWHLGTQTADTPGVPAMRDLQDFRLIFRAEVSALTDLLITKGVFTQEEYSAAVAREADLCSRQWEEFFPGYRATDEGVAINPAVAVETNRVRRFRE